MIRRYCITHLPAEFYAARIPDFVSVAQGEALIFVDVEISDPAAADDADAVMLELGYAISSVDPVSPLPALVVGGAAGTRWAFDIDAAGVLTLNAWTP